MSASPSTSTTKTYSREFGLKKYEQFLLAHKVRKPEQEIWDECEDYYENNSWTGQEKSIMKGEGRTPLQVNKLKANTDTLRSVILANKPTIISRPAGSDDNKVDNSQIFNELIKHILYQSNFQANLSRNTTTAINTGLFWFEAEFDPYAGGGEGDIRVFRVPVREVWLDPIGREADLSDHQRICRSKRVPLVVVKQMYGKKADKITTDTDQELEDAVRKETGSEEDYSLRARQGEDEWREAEEKDDGTVRLLTIYEKEYEEDPQAKTDGQGVVTIKKINRVRIRKIVLAGFDVLENELLDPRIDIFPLVPAMFVPTDERAYPLGIGRYGVPIQKEKNKIRTQILNIINRQVKAGIMYEEGAVDPTALKEGMSKPIALIPVKAGALKDKRVEFMPTPQFPVALANYDQYADRDLDVVYNIYDVQRGESDDSRASGKKVALLQEQGRSNANDLVQSIELSLTMLGRLLIKLIQIHYDSERVFHIVGDDGQTTTPLAINKPLQENGMPVNDPQTGQPFIVNDVRIGEYDCEVAAGSAMPSNRVLQQQMRIEYFDRGIIDGQAVLEHSDLPDRKDILQRVQTMQSMTTQLDELTNKVTEQDAMIAELVQELLGVELREMSKLGDVGSLIKALQQKITEPQDKETPTNG